MLFFKQVQVFRAEADFDDVKIGSGFNLDTGLKVNDKGVDVGLLGFGFSAGSDGVGIKLPIFDIKWKF